MLRIQGNARVGPEKERFENETRRPKSNRQNVSLLQATKWNLGGHLPES